MFTLLVSLLTGVLCGSLPAWQATKADFNETLKEGSNGATSGAHNRWRNALVVAEVALSLVLLVGAGLLIRSFIILLNADMGFNPDNTLAARIVLPEDRYAHPEQIVNFYQELAQRVAALPGVAAVGAVDDLPLGGWPHSSFKIVGRSPVSTSEQLRVGIRVATPGYFAAIGTPLRAGRLFTGQDDVNAPRVALVNEAFARRYFAGGSAIGRRLTLDNGPPNEIVGIVANTINLDGPAEPGVYLPFAQRANRNIAVIVRGQTNQAEQENVTQMVVKQGLRLVSLGVIIGLIGAFAVTRVLSQMLYGVMASDPITYAMIASLLLATALVACIVPARRATEVDPVVALRVE